MPYTIEPIPDPNWNERCNDSDHEPPKYVHIPNGFQLTHRCPSCGKSVTILSEKLYMGNIPYVGDPPSDQQPTVVELKGISIC